MSLLDRLGGRLLGPLLVNRVDGKLLEHYDSPEPFASQTARERGAAPDRHRLPALA